MRAPSRSQNERALWPRLSVYRSRAVDGGIRVQES
jgi:hypothetical protein